MKELNVIDEIVKKKKQLNNLYTLYWILIAVTLMYRFIGFPTYIILILLGISATTFFLWISYSKV